MDSRTTVPRVSVLLTSYNYAHFITQALDSIFLQEGVDFEIVLVDNGSTDNTLERIAPYRADPRLRVFINETNLGSTGNHNRAFEHSRGDYVVWLSADDRFLPGHFARALAWYDEHPEVDVFYTDALVAFSDGAAYGVRSEQFGDAVIPPAAYTGGRPEFADLLTRGCYMCWPTMLFRRELIEEFGPMDISFTGSDYEYVVRLAAGGKTFAYRQTPSAVICYHDAQLTGNAWHATGENITELARIVAKNLTPTSARFLRGRRGAVAAWLQRALADARGVDDALRERLMALVQRLPVEPVDCVTVMVFSEGRLGLLKRTLESLAAQTFTSYDVIVVTPLGYEIRDYVRMLLGHDRFQVFSDAVKSALALRQRSTELAGGDAIAYVHEGNTFAPDHLELGVAQLRTGFSTSIATANGRTETARSGSFTSNSDPRIDEGVFNDGSRPFGISDDVPLDALVHRRECWDYVDLIRPQAGYIAEWEYVLRLILGGGVGWTGKHTLEVLSIRQIMVHSHGDLKTWHVEAISKLHAALPVNEEHGRLRARYVERVNHLLAQPAPDARDFEALELWRRELSGATLYRLPAPAVR